MSKDENQVRSVWVLVHRCDGSYRGYPVGTVLVQDIHGHWLAFPSWVEAAAFTRDWLEQLRQLREEIRYVCEADYSGADGEVTEQAAAAQKRTIARLESALATLTQGVKPEALQ